MITRTRYQRTWGAVLWGLGMLGGWGYGADAPRGQAPPRTEVQPAAWCPTCPPAPGGTMPPAGRPACPTCGGRGCSTCRHLLQSWTTRKLPYPVELCPGACFGYFQTQWRRWEDVCPLPYQGVGVSDAPRPPVPYLTPPSEQPPPRKTSDSDVLPPPRPNEPVPMPPVIPPSDLPRIPLPSKF